jgi:hypothetical protein
MIKFKQTASRYVNTKHKTSKSAIPKTLKLIQPFDKHRHKDASQRKIIQ